MTETERKWHIYMARVFLAQARHSRQHPKWHARLLKWAAARRRAVSEPVLIGDQRGQGRLF